MSSRFLVTVVTAALLLGACAGSATAAPALAPRQSPVAGTACVRPDRIQDLEFSAAKYPTIHKHFLRALDRGWPRILAVNRRGADARRDLLLEDVPTLEGHDRDEYPPAVGRGRYRPALRRGTDPVGWRASVMYVPSGENRSHGASLGTKLRRFCNGTRFRYVFR